MNIRTDDSVSFEALLVEEQWLKRLARGLVAEHAAAEDLTQDVLVEALGSAPTRGLRGPQLRAWLSTTARRMAGRRGLRESQRGAVELEGAPPSVEDGRAVDRLVLSKAIAEALESIGAPYRTAVVMRYFDDLPPREIAAKTNAPVATVRQHVSRGLAMLRERLDRDYGDRSAWLAALGCLLPEGSLVPPPEAAAGAAQAGSAVEPVGGVGTGVGFMGTAVVLALGAAGLWLAGLGRSSEVDAGSQGEPEVVVASQTAGESALRQPSGATRELVQPTVQSEGSRMAAAAAVTSAPIGPSADEGTAVRIVASDGRSLTNPRAAWVDAYGSVEALEVTDGDLVTLPQGASNGHLLARADGYGSGENHYDPEARTVESGQIELEPLATLKGEVSVDEQPPGEVLLIHVRSRDDAFLSAMEHQPKYRAFSDLRELGLLPEGAEVEVAPNGHFSAPGLDQGTEGWIILPDSLVLADSRDAVLVGFSRPGSFRRIATTRRRYLFGRAVWADTGEPLQGSLMGSFKESGTGQGPGWSHWLPSTGRFEVGLPAAELDASRKASDGPQFEELWLSFRSEKGGDNVTEGWFKFDPNFEGDSKDLGEIRLTRASHTEVKVVDSAGHAIAGATLFPHGGFSSGTTDDQGLIRLSSAEGQRFIVSANGHRLRGFQVPMASSRDDSDSPLVIDLRAGATLRVTAPEFEGRERVKARPRIGIEYSSPLLADVEPWMFPEVADLGNHLRAVTTPRMQYHESIESRGTLRSHFSVGAKPLVVPGVIPGSTVRVSLMDPFGSELLVIPVTIGADGETTDVDLSGPTLAAGRLSLEVNDSLGREVALDKATVTSLDTPKPRELYASDENSVPYAAPGRYRVQAQAKGFVRIVKTIEHGAEDQVVQLTLHPARAVDLSFRAESDEPIVPSMVTLKDIHGTSVAHQRYDLASTLRFTEIPLVGVRAVVRYGTQEIEYELPDHATSADFTGPRLGVIEALVDPLPTVQDDWGGLELWVAEESTTESRISYSELDQSLVPSGLWRTSDSFLATAKGGLTLGTRVVPGRYRVTLLLEGDGADGVDQILREAVVEVAAGARVRL
jgi:RNA polymerase sigma-70 factor (ECF subfamily)